MQVNPRPPAVPHRVHRLWRHRGMLLAQAVLGLAGGLLLSQILPRQFRARATILPPREEQTGLRASALLRRLDIPGVQLPMSVSPSEMLLPALHSARIRTAVAGHVDLRRIYGPMDSLALLERLRRKSFFVVNPRGLLEIEVEAPGAGDAALVCNAYVFELDRFVRAHRTLAMRRTREVCGLLLAESRQRVDSLSNWLAHDARSSSGAAPTLEPDPRTDPAAALWTEHWTLRAQLGLLRNFASDSSQEVRSLQNRFHVLQRQLDQLPRLGQQRALVIQDLRAAERDEAFLSAQYEGAGLEERRDEAVLQPLDVARTPERPAWPKPWKFTLGSLLVALLVGAGWADATGDAQGTNGATPRSAWRPGSALVVSQVVLVALGSWLGWVPAILAAGTGMWIWRMGPDLRWPFMAALGAGVFTVYGGGQLTRELAVVSALAALAGVLGIHEYRRRGWSLARNGSTMALAAWFLVGVYGVALGLIRDNSPRFLGIDAFGTFGLLPALLAPLWRARRHAFLHLLAAFTLLSYASALFGLAAFARYHRRIGDAWFGPLPAMGALLLLSVAAHTPDRRLRGAALACVPVLLLHQLLSFTRGYWLGFVIGFLALLTVLVAGSRNRARAMFKAVGVTLAMGVLAAGALVGAQGLAGGELGASVGSRFGSSFSTEANTSTMSNIIRLVEWRAAVTQVARNPVLGYGAGATLAVQDPFSGTRNDAPYIHQMYLLQWFKYGIAGLLALLWIFVAFVRAGWREAHLSSSWQRRAVGTAVCANTLFMAAVCTSNYTLNQAFAGPPLAFLWGLLLPVVSAQGRQLSDWQGEGPSPEG